MEKNIELRNQLIAKHLEVINKVVGIKNYNPEEPLHLWRSLRRLEKKARRLSVLHSSSAEYYNLGTWEADKEEIETKLKSYFINPEKVFFNSDPRGAALKIDGDYVNLPFAFNDLGGNIQIAPDDF